MAEVAATPARAHDRQAEKVGRLAITSRQFYPAAALAITALALALRLHDIDAESLWRDEGFTLMVTHLPLLRVITAGGAHEHPPLYYVIVHAILSVHDSHLVPRLVAAVAGSLSVFALYVLGSRLLGGPAALIAAVFLAVSPFHLWHSQDGRGYELAGLLILLSYICLFSGLNDSRRRWWVGYTLCTVLALYVEYTSAFVLIPQALFLLRVRPSRPLLLSWGGIVALYLPWVGTLVVNVATVAASYWIAAPTLQNVAGTIMQMLGLQTTCPTLPTCSPSTAPVPGLVGHETELALVAAAIALAVLTWAIARRNFVVTILAVWLVVPFVVILLVSLRRPIYLDRLFLDATFPLYLLLGLGAVKSASRVWIWLPVAVALFGLFAMNVAGVNETYATTSNPNFKPAVAEFVSAYRPGQEVVYFPVEDKPIFDAYLPPGFRITKERVIWQHEYLDIAGLRRHYASVLARFLRDKRYPVSARYGLFDTWLREHELESATRGERQVWLLTEDKGGMDYVRGWFMRHGYFMLVSEIYEGETRLELWDRRPPQDFGPAVVRDDGFGPSWSRQGRVTVAHRTAVEQGRSVLAHGFPVTGGRAYTVDLTYQGVPPAYPSVLVETYDRDGRRVGGHRDHYGFTYLGFPRTHWYNMPVNGVWIREPFGFIAPHGAVRARILLRNAWGQTSWRNVGVYGAS